MLVAWRPAQAHATTGSRAPRIRSPQQRIEHEDPRIRAKVWAVSVVRGPHFALWTRTRMRYADHSNETGDVSMEVGT